MLHRSSTLIIAAFSALMMSCVAQTVEDGNAFAELSAESRVSKKLEAIVEALNTDKPEKAMKLIDEALKLSPDDLILQNARAAAIIKSERYDEASKLLTELVEKNPDFFQAEFNLGEILFLQDDFAGARVHFDQLRLKYGELPLLRFKILVCDLLSGNEAVAEQSARSFRFPSEAPAWYFVHAAIAAKKGNRKEARKLMDVATEIHGNDSTSLFSESIEKKLLN